MNTVNTEYFKFNLSYALFNQLSYRMKTLNAVILKEPQCEFINVPAFGNNSCILSSDLGSAFMITNFSVKHRLHFLIPPRSGWALKAIDHLSS